jgi:hypothetical protein
VSSSSFADAVGPEAPIATMLERAVDVLRGGCPRAHAEMARRLGSATVRLAVDDETFDVRVERGAPRIRPPDGMPTVLVRTTRPALRAVLAGRRTLADAVRADEVRAEGRLPDLVTLLGALEAFVHGAVRCDAIALLYRDLQSERAAG